MRQTQELGRTPFAYEDITIATDAISRLDATYREQAVAVFLTFETSSIRYRIDGGDPGADTGHFVATAAYQNLWLNDPASLRQLRMIAITNPAVARVTYYR